MTMTRNHTHIEQAVAFNDARAGIPDRASLSVVADALRAWAKRTALTQAPRSSTRRKTR